MSVDLLREWKKECDVLSSTVLGNHILDRAEVDGVYEIFETYFPPDFFSVNYSEPSIETKRSWIHFLLMNPKHTGCLTALFEIADGLVYLKTLSKSTQSKFKSLFKDPRQFRDMFFEIYMIHLLRYNHILVAEKPKEGDKELDFTCTIDETHFLCECRKVYAPGLSLLELETFLMEYFYIKDKTFKKMSGLIGTVKFTNMDAPRVKQIFKKRLDTFINSYNEQSFNKIEYHIKDEDGEFSFIDYSDANRIETEMLYNKSNFHVLFKVIPPSVIIPHIPNHFRIEMKARFNIPQSRIVLKVLSSINEKRRQHSNSTFTNKIYFIDSENIPDLDLPALRIERFDEEQIIQEYIDKNFSTNEIVCFIIRDYVSLVPRIAIKALGKNIDEGLKQKLEKLKTNFDYKIIFK